LGGAIGVSLELGTEWNGPVTDSPPRFHGDRDRGRLFPRTRVPTGTAFRSRL